MGVLLAELEFFDRFFQRGARVGIRLKDRVHYQAIDDITEEAPIGIDIDDCHIGGRFRDELARYLPAEVIIPGAAIPRYPRPAYRTGRDSCGGTPSSEPSAVILQTRMNS